MSTIYHTYHSSLTNEQTIPFSPSLAKEIGRNEFLILMVVHQYTAENRLEDIEDITELCRSYFPSLTSRAIKKSIDTLIKLGLLDYKDSLGKDLLGEEEDNNDLVINYNLLIWLLPMLF